jgi:hypothetical protein
MAEKIVYQLNENNIYVGDVEADESPLEPGVFLIPAGCVEEAPPVHITGMLRKYASGAWSYVEEINPEDEPQPVDPPTIAELNAPVLAEIAAEEAKQNRAVREALLLLLPAGVEKDRLKAIDDRIVLARGKLQK